MGNVVKLKGQRFDEFAELLVQALEGESIHDKPIHVIVEGDEMKIKVQRQLQCMTGMKATRIQIKTYAEREAEISQTSTETNY
jgi:hypothetical protein